MKGRKEEKPVKSGNTCIGERATIGVKCGEVKVQSAIQLRLASRFTFLGLVLHGALPKAAKS